MSYLHIKNLHADQTILLFRECFCLEKINGTSAHIRYLNGNLSFFSGGAPYANFCQLFNAAELLQKMHKLELPDMVVYGEAYGGKLQGMSGTYGPDLKFVVFEVKIGEIWLDVPKAEKIAHDLGLEFVAYVLIPATLQAIDAQRDDMSIQAIRNLGRQGMMREGIVLRPLVEMTLNNGQRVIAKHKRAEFRETRTQREVSPEKWKVVTDARDMAEEWVTPMRLQHVLDRTFQVAAKYSFDAPFSIENTGEVIKAMIEDVLREGTGEVVDSHEVRKAIGQRTAKLFQEYIKLDPVIDPQSGAYGDV